MTNYIVNDEELKELFWWYNNHDITVDDTIKDFLKSKQPVELVAEGVIKYDVQQVDEEEWELAGAYLECGDKKYWLNDVLPYDFLIKNENTPIKIYIAKNTK